MKVTSTYTKYIYPLSLGRFQKWFTVGVEKNSKMILVLTIEVGLEYLMWGLARETAILLV